MAGLGLLVRDLRAVGAGGRSPPWLADAGFVIEPANEGYEFTFSAAILKSGNVKGLTLVPIG